ncbi:MAG: DUF4294 domain-containing protein [Chitinophagales bacterium]|nr:DUF4294 domain-containing protein [Chitinophagales bacterium]
MKKVIILLFILTSFEARLRAQVEGQLLPLVVVGNDSFPTCTLQEVVVVSKRVFKDQADQYRYNRLRDNIVTVYPYAKEAGTIFSEINDQLAQIDKKKERKRFVKQKEKELDMLYENSLRNLTVTQGDLLVKLIARETGLTVYELISEFKNPFSAFYWNKLSAFYGYSLKQQYDPQEQRDIEMIVRSIEGSF